MKRTIFWASVTLTIFVGWLSVKTAELTKNNNKLPAQEQSAENGEFVKLCTVFPVNGKPVLGTYVAPTLKELSAVKDVGMNVIIGDDEALDPETPTGKFCRENGIKVMYHLTQFIYGQPYLTEPITAKQTTIPLSRAEIKSIPDSGVIQIEDELIYYGKKTDKELWNCRRGFQETNLAAHHENIFLFFPDACAAEIKRVQDSPNLYGYYVLDDPPGDVLSGLRAMYKIVKRYDQNPNHPVCAGYSLLGPLHNFAPDVCDIMLIYIYPVRWRGYQRYRISYYLQWMLTAARARVPGIPFFGVYQAFGYPTGNHAMPNIKQFREGIEDFVREGACGLISFECATSNGIQGWIDYNHLKKEIRSINSEILTTGGLKIALQPEQMQHDRVQPAGGWQTPQHIPGMVPGWYVAAPFDDEEGKVLQAVFPPETGINLQDVYQGKFGRIRWIKRRSASGVMLLTQTFPRGLHLTNVTAYAFCKVTSPKAQMVQMHVGSDDDALIWLNGEEVYRFNGVRGVKRDEDIVKVHLPAGQSRVLVKVYNRKGEWGLFMRLTDVNGNPLEGLSFSPESD